MSMQLAFSLLAGIATPATLPAAPDPTAVQLIAPTAFFGATAAMLFVVAARVGWFRDARWSPPRCATPNDATRLWIGTGAIVCASVLLPTLIVVALGRASVPASGPTPAGDVFAMLVTTATYLAVGVVAAAVHATLGWRPALAALGVNRPATPVHRVQTRDAGQIDYASPRTTASVARGADAWVVMLGAPFAIALTTAVASLTQLLRTLAGYHQPSAHAMLLLMQRNEGSPSVLVLTILNATLLAPLAEELLFRGHLQTALTSLFPRRWPAIAIASTLFAAMHEPWMIPPIFALSLVIGYLYERTGNLWVAIATHVAFNATSTAVFLISRGAM